MAASTIASADSPGRGPRLPRRAAPRAGRGPAGSGAFSSALGSAGPASGRCPSDAAICPYGTPRHRLPKLCIAIYFECMTYTVKAAGIRKSFGGGKTQGRPRRRRPRRSSRIDLRPARPERRRQDHPRPHPRHADPPGRGHRDRGRPRPARRPGRGPPLDQPHRPVRRRRRHAHRRGEPADDGPPAAPAAARGGRPQRRAAGRVRPRRRPRPAGQDLLGRHAPAPRPRDQHDRAARRCCSSTSPPPASTRAAGSSSGGRSGSSPTRA